MDWRSSLMEYAVSRLELNKVTEPILEGHGDPYRMLVVHDYAET